MFIACFLEIKCGNISNNAFWDLPIESLVCEAVVCIKLVGVSDNLIERVLFKVCFFRGRDSIVVYIIILKKSRFLLQSIFF
jgi:hypothetical protein